MQTHTKHINFLEDTSFLPDQRARHLIDLILNNEITYTLENDIRACGKKAKEGEKDAQAVFSELLMYIRTSPNLCEKNRHGLETYIAFILSRQN